MLLLRHLFDHDVDGCSLQLRSAVEAAKTKECLIVDFGLGIGLVVRRTLEPRVLQCLLRSDPLLRALFKHLLDDVSHVLAEVRWHLRRGVLDV